MIRVDSDRFAAPRDGGMKKTVKANMIRAIRSILLRTKEHVDCNTSDALERRGWIARNPDRTGPVSVVTDSGLKWLRDMEGA